MTIKQFKMLARKTGFNIEGLALTPISVFPTFGYRMPFANEFVTTTVSAILTKK